MKTVRNFDSFKNHNNNYEPVNEEIFGAIGKFFSNMFAKAKERVNKTKGGKEIEAIYQKYLKQINDQLSKQAKVELNIGAATDAKEGQKPAEKTATPEKPGEKKEEEKKESRLLKYDSFRRINEAEEGGDEVDAKTAVEQLKGKQALIQGIVKKLKEMALKEMDAVLVKMGGAQKNPQLQIIINAKKDQFELDFMNAQINYLEQAGDKVMSKEIQKKRDTVAKNIENTYKNFDKAKPVELKEGDKVIYLRKDKKKEEWDALSDKEKENPEEGKAKDIVAVNKLVKIDGDKYKIETEDGKEIEKKSSEIIGPAKGGGGEVVDFKDGDTVIFKRKDFDDKKDGEEWGKIKDEDKKNPESDAVKKMIADGKINVKKVEKIEGEDFVFKGEDDKDLKSPKASVLSKVEGEKKEGEGEKKEEGQGKEEEGQGKEEEKK